MKHHTSIAIFDIPHEAEKRRCHIMNITGLTRKNLKNDFKQHTFTHRVVNDTLFLDIHTEKSIAHKIKQFGSYLTTAFLPEPKIVKIATYNHQFETGVAYVFKHNKLQYMEQLVHATTRETRNWFHDKLHVPYPYQCPHCDTLVTEHEVNGVPRSDVRQQYEALISDESDLNGVEYELAFDVVTALNMLDNLDNQNHVWVCPNELCRHIYVKDDTLDPVSFINYTKGYAYKQIRINENL